MSRVPSIFRQDDVAFQVPTALPPQGVTLVHEAVGGAPLDPAGVPALELVPALTALPAVGAVPPELVEVPAVPAGRSELTLHAPEKAANAAAATIATAAVWIFMGWSLFE